MCHRQGWGVKKDRKVALSYFELAASLGDADAQQELAFCYLKGKGTKVDKMKAAKFFRLAEAQGIKQWYLYARILFGTMLINMIVPGIKRGSINVRNRASKTNSLPC